MPLDGSDERVERAEMARVAEVAGDAEDGVLGGVVAGVVGADHPLVEAVEGAEAAGDGVAERVVGVEDGAGDVVGVDVAAVVVEVLQDLLADDAALDLDLREAGGHGDLGEQGEDALEVDRRHGDAHHAVVDVGGGVGVAPRRSKASAWSCAEASDEVPRKTMCSRKWEMPLSCVPSKREPTRR